MNMIIDGLKFEGPYIIGQDEIPAMSGVALVCTEAGEGIKILSVEESADLNDFIMNCDRMDLWKAASYKGIIKVFVYPFESESERIGKADSIASKRADVLTCQKKTVIEDDW